MSSNLLTSKYFLKVILNNNKTLNKHMFSEVNQSQIKAIAEIFYNIFRLPLSKKTKTKFEKYSELIKRFLRGVRGRLTTKLLQLLKRHHRIFSDLLYSMRRYINQILQ